MSWLSWWSCNATWNRSREKSVFDVHVLVNVSSCPCQPFSWEQPYRASNESFHFGGGTEWYHQHAGQSRGSVLRDIALRSEKRRRRRKSRSFRVLRPASHCNTSHSCQALWGKSIAICSDWWSWAFISTTKISKIPRNCRWCPWNSQQLSCWKRKNYLKTTKNYCSYHEKTSFTKTWWTRACRGCPCLSESC